MNFGANIQPEVRAFPVSDEYGTSYGMTLRDYFAAKAMQAMISNPSWFGSRRWDTQEEMAEDYANEAYLFATEMLFTRGDR